MTGVGRDSELIRRFANLGREDLKTAGGKGAQLGELTRAGLPVPPGFVLLTAAYQGFMMANGLQDRIADRLEGLPTDDLSALGAACAEIQGWITSTQVAGHIEAALTAAYAGLAARAPGTPADPPVAVRSSATAEDLPEASFAGQQETFLNVRGAAGIMDAVRRCWASLWTPRAVSYRGRMGYDHFSVSLAVVVQALVPAEVAGVMFTANPVTGARDRFMLTASYGLGEAVVSGAVTPDTYVLSLTGTVLERRMGAKEVRILPDSQGTRTEAVPADERSRYCVTDQDLEALADLGRRVATHYGSPQDIEWALAGGRLYLLQSRPITTLPSEPAPELTASDGQMAEPAMPAFMAHNLADHFPEPLKPLDFGQVQDGLAAGLAVQKEVGMSTPPVEDLIVELPDGRIAVRLQGVRPTVRLLWRAPARLLRALRTDPLDAWEKLRSEVAESLRQMERDSSAELDASGLVHLVHRIRTLFAQLMPRRFAGVMLPGLLHTGLVHVWVRWALGKAAAPDTARRLFLAVPYRTAQMNRAVARLVQVAAEHGRESATFAGALAEFLAEWGTRPARGMAPVPSFPTWCEEPGAVLGLVDALLENSQAYDADSLERGQETQFAEARNGVVKRLGGLTGQWFLWSLERARRYLVAREDGLGLLEQMSALLRRDALQLGARLAELGVINERDDIFFLLPAELGPATRCELAVQERVARRKQAYARIMAEYERGEHWLVTSGSTRTLSQGTAGGENGLRLTGAAASGGRVRGRVCVVRGPSDFSKLRKGDILVAPFTAPAWTPLFTMAAAVVTDVGSPLSHAAIVAREYGIPAVVAIGRATGILRDGQHVTVDGDKGCVTAHHLACSLDDKARSQRNRAY